MLIERAHLRHFGPFVDLELGPFAADLVIVHGPNEAGKSTLRHFLRWMLFGGRSRKTREWASAEGGPEGMLHLRHEGAALVVERRAQSFTLRRGKRVEQGKGALEALLQGVDDDIFERIFSFDFLNLNDIGALNERAVQDRLTLGSTELAGLPLQAVEKALRADIDLIWRPRAPKTQLRLAEARLKQLQAELRAAQATSRQHRELRARFAGIEVQRAENVAQRRAALEVAEGLRRCLEAWPLWVALQESEAAWLADADLPLPEIADEEGVEALRAAYEQAKRSSDEAQQACEEEAASLAHIERHPGYVAAAASVRALARRIERVEERQRWLDTSAGVWTEAEAAVARASDALGVAPAALVRWQGVPNPALSAAAARHANDTARLLVEVPRQEALVAKEEGELAAALASLAARQVPILAIEDEGAPLHHLLDEAAQAVMWQKRAQELRELLAQRTPAPDLTPESAWPAVTRVEVEEAEQWWRRLDEAQRERGAQRLAAQRQRDGAAQSLARAEEALGALPVPAPVDTEALRALLVRGESLAEWRRVVAHAVAEQQRHVTAADAAISALGLPLGPPELAAVATSRHDEQRLHGATRALENQREGLARAEEELQRRRAALGAPLTPDALSVEEARARHDGLHLLRGEFEAYQDRRARSGGERPLAVAPPRWWLGPLLLLAVGLVAALLQVWVVSAVATAAALGLAWVQRRGGRPDPGSAASTLADAEQALRRACESQGMAFPPSRGQIDLALERARVAWERAQRHAEALARHQEAVLALAAAQQKVDAARADFDAAAQAYADCCEQLGLPVLDVAMVPHVVATAAEVQRSLVSAQRATAEGQDAAQRIQALAADLGGVLGRRVAASEVDLALARARELGEQQRRDSERLRMGRATRDAQRQALTEAEAALAAVQGEGDAVVALQASWRTWLRGRMWPEAALDEAYLQRVRMAEQRTRDAAERKGAAEALAEVERSIEAFERTLVRLLEAAAEARRGSWEADLAVLREWRQKIAERRQVRALLAAEQEELQARSARLAERQRAVAEQRQLLADALVDFDGWRGQLQAPETLPAGEALSWYEKVSAAVVALTEKERLAGERARAQVEVEGFMQDFTRLAEALGQEAAPTVPAAVARIEGWTQALSQAESAELRFQERQQGRDAKSALWAQKRAEAAAAAEAFVAALAPFGCVDAAQWQARRSVAQQRRLLAQRRQTQIAELRGALGALWDDATFMATLRSGRLDAWRESLSAIEESLGRREEEVARFDEELGRLRAEMARSSDSAHLVQLGTELQGAEAEVMALRLEVGRLIMAQHLLRETFERYRRERQPPVLSAAGRRFAQATDGAYVGLLSGEEEQVLLVEDQRGHLHPAAALSTGAMALLYFCLRLSLALDYGSRKCTLPLMLDDLLTHFDPERGLAAARLLVEVAAAGAQQVMVFTCRPESRDLLLSLRPTAQVLELERWRGLSGPARRA